MEWRLAYAKPAAGVQKIPALSNMPDFIGQFFP